MRKMMKKIFFLDESECHDLTESSSQVEWLHLYYDVSEFQMTFEYTFCASLGQNFYGKCQIQDVFFGTESACAELELEIGSRNLQKIQYFVHMVSI